MRQIIVAGRPITPRRIILDGTAHTDIVDPPARNAIRWTAVALVVWAVVVIGLAWWYR